MPTPVAGEQAAGAAATAVAAIPTQPAAPAARPAALAGRLLIATTRLSSRPNTDLPIDYRLAWLSTSGLEPIPLPDDEQGVADAAVSPDGSQIAVIVGRTRILRLGANGAYQGDLGPRLAPLTVIQPDWYLSVAWIDPRRLLIGQTAPVGLFILQADETDRQPLPEKGLNPSVSPDGRRIALGFVRDEPFYSIYVADLAFTQLRRLTADALTESSAAWSPDGQWIAYAANAGYADEPTPTIAWELRVVRPNGTDQRTLVPRAAGVSYPEIRWSPDGRQLAFTRHHEFQRTRRIGVVDLESGRELAVSDGFSNDRVLAWLP